MANERIIFRPQLRGLSARRIIRAMPLSEQEKNGLRDQLALLLEANEPESILATLQRLAERKAHSVTRGAITELEALRWQALADACASAAQELERANAPRQTPQTPIHAQQLAQPTQHNAQPMQHNPVAEDPTA